MSSIRPASAFCLGLFLWSGAALVRAEQAPPPATPPANRSLAVIDIQEVLNNHARFKAAQAELKGDVARAEGLLKAQGEEIKKMAEGLKGLLPGTRDHMDLQEKVNKRAEELKTQVEVQRAEFVGREAKAYHAAYREIVEEIARYAAENHIEIVLRTYAPDKTETPQQVLQDLNKPVVWCAPGNDITEAILERLNKKAAAETPKEKPAEKPEPPKAEEKPQEKKAE